MDLFLLIATIVISILLVLINLYLLAVYVHPEDRGFGASIFPKAIVILGLTLSWGQVLMVSLDVSNARNHSGLNMDVFWQISIIATTVTLVLLIPFASALYDTDEQKAFRQRVFIAVTYTLAVTIGLSIAFFVSRAFVNTTRIPVTIRTLVSTSLLQSSTSAVAFDPTTVAIGSSTVNFPVSIVVYLMAFFTFIGWVLLVFFGGMGLFAIPLDFISEYKHMPVKKTPSEISKDQQGLREKISELIQMGQGIEESQKEVEEKRGFVAKRKAQAGVNKDVNKFKASVLSLEQDFDTFSAEVNFQTVNPVTYKFKLAIGIFLMIISLILWIDILFGCLKTRSGFQRTSFLNIVLIYIGESLVGGFISTFIFAALSLYLIAAVTKGNVKFGLKIPFFFTIHPMKPNETLMNSFLFNVWLILVTALAVVQLLTSSFEQYARLTSAQFYFDTMLKYMPFFSIFYVNKIFEIAFLGWSLLTLLALGVCGNRRSRFGRKNDKNEKLLP